MATLSSALLFFISAWRAILEMLGWALLAQAALALLAGRARADNLMYQLFALITRGPRHACGKLLPGPRRPWGEGVLCFLLLLVAWLGLAFWRLHLLAS
ncbi:hypothetical protein [Azonexus sp.]|uniref:hypothetical protein n=1 Tax=Azonexus sp. TaxID=1872668 RepID=UPI0039E64871